MVWDKHDVWAGNVGKENGEWLIGDHLPENHPGHVDAEDPRGLMVKYWTASLSDGSRKYLGRGHEPPLPAHGGRIEGVQVLFGQFCCECRDRILELGRGTSGETSRDDSVDLGPDEYRRWFLESSTFAWGTTICRHGHGGAIPGIFGSGEGYEYFVLDTTEVERDTWLELLRGPAHLASWSHQLIMVFRGSLTREYKGKITHRLAALSKSYAYVRPTTKGTWLPTVEPRVRTIVAVVRY